MTKDYTAPPNPAPLPISDPTCWRLTLRRLKWWERLLRRDPWQFTKEEWVTPEDGELVWVKVIREDVNE